MLPVRRMRCSLVLLLALHCTPLHGQTGGQHAPPAAWRLATSSAVIVEVTALRFDWVVRPERMGQRMENGILRAANPSDYHDGYVYILRVDDIVKGDGLVATGGEILIYTGGSIHEFFPVLGDRMLLFLNYVWGTPEETKLRGAKRVSINPVPSLRDPSGLPNVNLAQVYRVAHQRATTMRDYEAYKELLRAQSKPVAWVAQPAAGATLQGNVTLRAQGYDDNAITSMQFRLDGEDLGPALTEWPFSTTWRSKDVANGTHTLAVLTRDSTGEETLSEPITITTQNANVAPVVSAWPPAGSGFTSAFNWNWSDPDGDPLLCTFTIVEFTQCSFAGHCAEAGNAAAGVTPCQARVEYGQPLFTHCTYRLACTDGWTSTTAEFVLN